MSSDKADIMDQFGRVSRAYASSPDFASGDDLDILLNLVKPDPSMVSLDVATGAGHTAVKMAQTSMYTEWHFGNSDTTSLYYAEDYISSYLGLTG